MTEDKSSTKYIVLVGDGMADYPLPELDGKTPLEVAYTPNLDRIASCRIGLVKTIPNGLTPGSDVANLSLLGYNPREHNTGRGPLEAASMGVTLSNNHVAFRMNLVTLDIRSNDEIVMVSHSAGDITTEEALEIIRDLKREMNHPGIEIYQGVAYRHVLLWNKSSRKAATIPPHDMLGQNVASYLARGSDNAVQGLIRRSWSILENHSINVERRNKGLEEANSIWLWGQGKALKLTSFREKFGLKGGVISAVDLIKGIGIYAGFIPIHVEGATGYLNTNFRGKAEAALKWLEELDFVFLHVEAPDEAGHSGNHKEKVKAIEDFDEKVVGVVLRGLNDFKDYRVMIASDHFTPICKRTHTREPAPFAWASKRERNALPEGPGFTEKYARESGLFFEKGHDLMPAFLSSE